MQLKTQRISSAAASVASTPLTLGHALARRSRVVRNVVHAVLPSPVLNRLGSWEVRWPVDSFQLCIPHRLQSVYECIWEPATVAYLKQALHPGMTAIDVGANVGALSLVMAHAVGPQGRVIAIEPGTDSLRWLRRNVAHNQAGNVTVVNVAAGAQTGRRSFHLHQDLAPSSFYDYPEVQWRGTVDVDQKTLDELCPGAVDLIKIDAEGAELEVLQGASRLLASGPRLVVEWWPEAPGHSPTALLSTLVELGYHLTIIDDQPEVTCGVSLEELAVRAETRALPPGWYVNLACERRY